MSQTAPRRMNGHGAVDLGGLKDRERQKQAVAVKLLGQAGLVCGCGERIRDRAVQYFTLVEAMLPSPRGPQPGVKLEAHTACSTTCDLAGELEGRALARREGATGKVTWLDELRQARGTGD